MELTDILKIFKKHGFNEYNCPFFKDEDIINIASELKEAINYSQCCTQLLCVDKWCYNDLTKGNKYKMVTENDEYYTIVNDWGEICEKDKDLFELIKQ